MIFDPPKTTEQALSEVRTLGRLALLGEDNAEEALAAIKNAENTSSLFLPFRHLRDAFALDTAGSLAAAACLTAAREARGEKRICELWRDWGGAEMPAIFTWAEGDMVLRDAAFDFLEDRIPRLPAGARLEFPGGAALYHDEELAGRLRSYLARLERGECGPAAVVLCGPSGCGRKFLFGQAARDVGCGLLVMEDSVSPAMAGELMVAARLYGALPCIDDFGGDGALPLALTETANVLFVAAGEGFRGEISGWPTICRRVGPLSSKQQQKAVLAETGDEKLAETMAGQRLSMGQIAALARNLPAERAFGGEPEKAMDAPPHGTELLETGKKLADIFLPEEQTEKLRRLCEFVKVRETVYGEWGLDEKIPYGRGLSALFYGASGTGKTLAASAVANELGLPCYRADLSRLVSKYIGETQKNIGRVFDESERTGCVLFFDEADALFSRRAEGQDAQDQYRNGEIAYLLQRMEQYDGLVLLASNLLQNFDDAFKRRIHYMILFPMPDAALRERLWRGMLPERAPVGTIDWKALAAFELSGAGIKNCMVHGALLAASQRGKLCTERLLEAVGEEYAKLGKPLPAGRYYRKG